MCARILNVEKIITKDKITNKNNGIFMPIWRDWDSKYNSNPQMAYIATIPAGEIKGPHLHKKRTGYITVISGRLVFILNEDGKFTEIEQDAEKPGTIEVLPGVGLVTINVGSTTGMILNLCNPAWHPENQDNFVGDFSGYDFSKWQVILDNIKGVK